MKLITIVLFAALSTGTAMAGEGGTVLDSLRAESAGAAEAAVPVPAAAVPAAEPDLDLLARTKLSCEVAFVLETEGKELKSSYSPAAPVAVESRQWGPKKCMVIPTKSPSGKDKEMAFWGCFMPEMVKVFDAERLTTEDTKYNWVIDIDLKSGDGLMSYDYLGILWPGRPVQLTGRAVLKNCHTSVKP